MAKCMYNVHICMCITHICIFAENCKFLRGLVSIVQSAEGKYVFSLRSIAKVFIKYDLLHLECHYKH